MSEPAQAEGSALFACECGVKFFHRSSLSRHKANCWATALRGRPTQVRFIMGSKHWRVVEPRKSWFKMDPGTPQARSRKGISMKRRKQLRKPLYRLQKFMLINIKHFVRVRRRRKALVWDAAWGRFITVDRRAKTFANSYF